MADRIGEQLGLYRLTRLVGKGAFAEVYLAEHVRMLTQAAVKVLHAQLAREEEERFQEEARTLARLTHPHIIHLHDYAVHDGTPYLVMDYAPNGTLRQRFPKGTPQPPGEVLPYVWQVAEALHFAHGQHLVHRDVKPENMLLDANNEVLLSDFGIAVVSQSSSYKAAQEVMGTATYMAPEQVRARAVPASDQYSLAVLVYEWLCGVPPFQGSMTEVMAKHLFAEPPRMRERVRTISPAIEVVVMGALSKDPEDRFPSVSSFASAFDEACQAVPMLLFAAPSVVAPVEAEEQTVTESAPAPAPAPEPPAAPAAAEPEPAPPAPAAPEGPEPAPAPALPSRPSGPVIQQMIDALPEPPAALPESEPAPAAYPQNVPPQIEPKPAPPAFSFQAEPKPAPTFAPQPAAWGVPPAAQPMPPVVLSAPAVGPAATPEAQAAAPGLSYPVGAAPPVVEAAPAPGGRSLGPTWREVNWIPAPASSGPAPAFQPLESPRRGISRRTLLVGGLAGVVVVGGTLAWAGLSRFTGGSHPATPTKGTTPTPPAPTPIPPGTTLFTYTGHTGFVRGVAWSPDGTRIASASDDHTVQVWGALDGASPLTYSKHTREVLAVSWSPDGALLASGGRDFALRVWNATSGEALHTFGFNGRVTAVAWSPDGAHLAAGSWDATVQIWDTKTWLRIHRFTASGAVNALAWSPDNQHLVSGDSAHQAIIWNAVAGGRVLTYRRHASTILALAWSPDGTQIASGSDLPAATMQDWNSTSGDLIWNAVAPDQTPALAWSPQGGKLAAGGKNAYLLNPQDGSQLLTYQGDAWTVAWSPDGKHIASGGEPTTVQVWQAT